MHDTTTAQTASAMESPMSREDVIFVMNTIDQLRKAGIDRDPALRLVVRHPAVPAGDVTAQIYGRPAEHGPLAVMLESTREDQP